MYVAIFAGGFYAFCLLCCFGRFRFSVALFALLPLCLALNMQCLGEVCARCVLFVFFFLFSTQIWRCCFCSCVCPLAIRAKYDWVIRAHMNTPVPTHRVPLYPIAPLCPSKPFVDIRDLPVLCVCLMRVHIMIVLVFVFVCVARVFSSRMCLFVCMCLLLCLGV